VKAPIVKAKGFVGAESTAVQQSTNTYCGVEHSGNRTAIVSQTFNTMLAMIKRSDFDFTWFLGSCPVSFKKLRKTSPYPIHI